MGYHFSLLNLAFGGLAEYPEQIRQLFKTQSVSQVPLELSQTNRVGLGRWRLKRNQEAADPWLLTQFFFGESMKLMAMAHLRKEITTKEDWEGAIGYEKMPV